MKVLIDVNLGVEWKDALVDAGIEALLWRDIGDARAFDAEIMRWAAERDYVVLTQDLDFGQALAVLKVDRPSVVLLRTRRGGAQRQRSDVVWAMRTFAIELEAGALLVVDPEQHRIRMLPLS